MNTQTITLRNNTSVSFVLDASGNIYAHLPGDPTSRKIGMVVNVGRSWAWCVSDTPYWQSYSTIYKLPIATSAVSAFKQALAYIQGGKANEWQDN